MNVTKLDNEDFTKPLVNKVAQSGLVTINLENYLKQEILELDLKDFLFHGLLLKEKDFRHQVNEYDWSAFKNQPVTLFCSTDALIQQWAYMLLASRLMPYTTEIYYGSKEEAETKQIISAIQLLDLEKFKDKKVIVKGCSRKEISDEAYLEITTHLLPVVKSLMFGEACSTVPVYKKKE